MVPRYLILLVIFLGLHFVPGARQLCTITVVHLATEFLSS
nr:MAG TPA: hypothetical protein [Caudoviricetes sp.]